MEPEGPGVLTTSYVTNSIAYTSRCKSRHAIPVVVSKWNQSTNVDRDGGTGSSARLGRSRPSVSFCGQYVFPPSPQTVVLQPPHPHIPFSFPDMAKVNIRRYTITGPSRFLIICDHVRPSSQLSSSVFQPLRVTEKTCKVCKVRPGRRKALCRKAEICVCRKTRASIVWPCLGFAGISKALCLFLSRGARNIPTVCPTSL